MRAWRWITVVLVMLYAIQSTFPAVYTTSMKFGWTHASANMQRFVALTNATSILQIAIWWVAIVLLVMTAWRLVRQEPALGTYIAAFILNAGNWLSLKLGSVYNQTFDAGEQKFDYVLLGIMAIIGLAIWFIERGETRVVQA
jgi:hypothetical protein